MSPNSQKLGLQKWQRAFPSHRQKKNKGELSEGLHSNVGGLSIRAGTATTNGRAKFSLL